MSRGLGEEDGGAEVKVFKGGVRVVAGGVSEDLVERDKKEVTTS